ncbi:tRNA (5-methylaminomethyl-2-thiouridine)(34)-methyltransferase MnmD [Mucilaginibacter myungsuensis]|uniref:tRNA (5-methylaminomethyl-2-thiouridine)(34)-methyltransferase MnmD n=1 Tax=Mucilaginibacter myungsuensis TaxID=649104 RepID=A0A929L1I4_9SPHI|nr:tRNA (5-methylaminomethyl-2-thiouridine)(34)-methyltransferase MnmD [Mucilaginibacter myungsuensis]MBE9664540.1 tRNA (5-methylaminomethyl-2-thiouridine)(34)-methyltransferase MnmD [Mucilaginibacter myungsuensis]MDN3601110.1 tRNA (5-methylaminomethyl-2-thiouridine)(34)-methyltransferase MnmD [Mucilaginibacter myungsuensis]
MSDNNNIDPGQGLSFVTTGDGSKTIWNPQVGENYHSKHGALQESIHVFLNSGLRHFLELTGGDKASILEVGLGTGLNFLVTADFCTKNNIQLEYTGIEAYPLSTDMLGQTGYDQYVSPSTWENFQSWYPSSINHLVQVNEHCQLKTAHTKLTDFTSDELYDVIYFDAFAAIHQPEMWNQEAIAHTVKFLRPGGIFVTYAITGNLKRMLKALSLKVEKAPGAPGKREMLRAVLSRES